MKNNILTTLVLILKSARFLTMACVAIFGIVALYFYLSQFENLFLSPTHITNIITSFVLFVFSLFIVQIFFRLKEKQSISRVPSEASWVENDGQVNESEYIKLLNVLSDIVFELDEQANVHFMNQPFEKITRIPISDILGHRFFDIFPASQRAKNIERYQKFLNGELNPYRVKTNIEMYDGTPRQIEVSFRYLIKKRGGQKHVVGTIEDKQSLVVAKQAIVAAEEKYKEMFEHGVSGIYQTTPGGQFINANSTLAQLLGYESAKELIQAVQSIGAQVYVRPEDRAIFKNKMESVGQVVGYESQMYKKDGTKIWVVENSRTVLDANGQLQYYEGSLWDVTERRKTEENLKEAKVIAEMNSRAKTEFLANMSHELRTPLNAIIGFSEIIKDEIMGPLNVPDYKEYATDIYKSGNGLLKIISEILEVSKIESGKRSLNEGPVKISRAVGACLVILKSKMDDGGLSIALEVPEALPEIIGEELVVKQILINLLNNAIKFTPEGGKITIRSEVDRQTGKMILDVIDTGIGMTAEEIEKATQPFWQANADNLARETDGTGLGLTLVQSLTKMHQAELKLESEKGAGTIARVIFPKERIIVSAAKKPIGDV